MSSAITPQLSIIMPFYNNKELIVEMIDSIVANSFKDWELLAIDDGSSKETLEFLKKYTNDYRIHIIKRDRDPKGAQTCRNIGIEKMRGEYVVFFDSDDYITPNCLQTRMDAIRRHPSLDFMVFPSGTYVGHTFHPAAPKFIYGYNIHKNDIASFARRELPFIVWTNIYRSEAIKNHHIKWDENLLSLQDADFNMTAILAGMKYQYACVSPDYGYRISYSQESTSKKILTEKHFNSHIYAVDKFYNQLQSIYGHKYDFDTFQGLLFIYNTIFTDRIDKPTAIKMATCIFRHNRLLGCVLRMQILLTTILEKIIPAKRARQIPMTPYLIAHTIREKKTRKRINSINIESE